MSVDGDYRRQRRCCWRTREIDCQNTTGTAIGEANVTVRRLNIHGCENGFDIGQNVTVEDSYIHDLYNSAEAHTDGIQFASRLVDGQVVKGVLNVTIRHNTIYGMGADGSFGTSAIISNSGGDTNVLIENNLLAGGGSRSTANSGATGTNYRVHQQPFQPQVQPEGRLLPARRPSASTRHSPATSTTKQGGRSDWDESLGAPAGSRPRGNRAVARSDPPCCRRATIPSLTPQKKPPRRSRGTLDARPHNPILCGVGIRGGRMSMRGRRVEKRGKWRMARRPPLTRGRVSDRAPPARLHGLDGIRGVAALFVVLHHC